jgi:hypothetical protein
MYHLHIRQVCHFGLHSTFYIGQQMIHLTQLVNYWTLFQLLVGWWMNPSIGLQNAINVFLLHPLPLSTQWTLHHFDKIHAMNVEFFFYCYDLILFDVLGHIGGDDLYQSMPWWRTCVGGKEIAWKTQWGSHLFCC